MIRSPLRILVCSNGYLGPVSVSLGHRLYIMRIRAVRGADPRFEAKGSKSALEMARLGLKLREEEDRAARAAVVALGIRVGAA